MTKQQELVDFDVMKVLTMLLVVVGHVLMMYKDFSPIVPQVGSTALVDLYNYIYSFHMPAFVAISGAVYYYVKRERGRYNNPLSFVQNKVKRLLIPYVFFATLVVFPTNYLIGNVHGGILKTFVKNFVLALSPDHLWFLLALFVIFVVFNTLEKAIYKWTFCSLLLFAYLSIFLSEHTFKPYFGIARAGSLLIYFYLGYLFQRHKASLLSLLTRLPVVVLLIALHAVCYAFRVELASWWLLKYVLMFLIPISGMLLVYLLSYWCSLTALASNRTFGQLSSSSFGIYLFHQPLIYLMFYGVRHQSVSPFVLSSLVVVMCILASLAMIALMRKLRLNIFVGE